MLYIIKKSSQNLYLNQQNRLLIYGILCNILFYIILFIIILFYKIIFYVILLEQGVRSLGLQELFFKLFPYYFSFRKYQSAPVKLWIIFWKILTLKENAKTFNL